MLRLRKFTKLLVADGIIASNILMYIHLTSFWIVSILNLATCISTIAALLEHYATKDNYFNSFAIVIQ